MDRRTFGLIWTFAATGLASSTRAEKASRKFSIVETFVGIEDIEAGDTRGLRTCGYRTPGDGGQAWYARLDGTPATIAPWMSRTRDGVWFALAEDAPNPLMFGANQGEALDSSKAVQAALDYGAPVVECARVKMRLDTTVVLAEQQSLLNVNFQAGTPGMNMVLVSSGCRITGALRGTGTTGVVERGVFPGRDGVSDVTLDLDISNLTFGVQACPRSEGGPRPNRWRLDIRSRDIVGADGESEGYTVLLSPADKCFGTVRSVNTQRHTLYLSAGASDNDFDVFAEGNGHSAVAMYSKDNQPWTERNRVRARVRGCHETTRMKGYVSAVGVYVKARNNHLTVDVHSNNETTFAARAEGIGLPEGPHPRDNVFIVRATGVFRGDAVVLSSDAVNTMFQQPFIQAKAKLALIGFTQGARNPKAEGMAGSVRGGFLDGVDSSNIGINIATGTTTVSTGQNILFANLLRHIVSSNPLMHLE